MNFEQDKEYLYFVTRRRGNTECNFKESEGPPFLKNVPVRK